MLWDTRALSPYVMLSLKILVGSYTSVITTLLFSTSPPSLRIYSTSPAGSNPSWIASHPSNRSLLFATQENTPGRILSFFVQPDGSAARLSSASSGGNGPAYLGFSDDGSEIYLPNVCGDQFFINKATLKSGVLPVVW